MQQNYFFLILCKVSISTWKHLMLTVGHGLLDFKEDSAKVTEAAVANAIIAHTKGKQVGNLWRAANAVTSASTGTKNPFV